MSDVLASVARPDTAEARAAGDVALAAGAVLFVGLLAFGALAALPPSARGSARPARLPLVATAADDVDAFTGMETGGGRLRLATGSENGVVALFRGGEEWRDYTLRVRARWSGDAFALHLRETAADTYVACVVDRGRARIDEVRAGVTRTVATGRVPLPGGRTTEVAATVTGTNVRMTVDGRPVAAGTLAVAGTGSAGIAVSDAAWSAAYAEIERASVEPVPARGRMKPAAVPARGKGKR